MKTVYFIGKTNSIRSQMAEGLLVHLKGHIFEAASGGTTPGNRMHPMTIAVMAEIGIDISKHKPKPIDAEALATATQIISFIDPNDLELTDLSKKVTYWAIAEPEFEGLHPAIRRFRKIRDKIKNQIMTLESPQPW